MAGTILIVEPHPAVKRALFRQPLALQWWEGKDLVKRSEGERQAGEFSIARLVAFGLSLTLL